MKDVGWWNKWFLQKPSSGVSRVTYFINLSFIFLSSLSAYIYPNLTRGFISLETHSAETNLLASLERAPYLRQSRGLKLVN
jgi:hypothetical protein